MGDVVGIDFLFYFYCLDKRITTTIWQVMADKREEQEAERHRVYCSLIILSELTDNTTTNCCVNTDIHAFRISGTLRERDTCIVWRHWRLQGKKNIYFTCVFGLVVCWWLTFHATTSSSSLPCVTTQWLLCVTLFWQGFFPNPPPVALGVAALKYNKKDIKRMTSQEEIDEWTLRNRGNRCSVMATGPRPYSELIDTDALYISRCLSFFFCELVYRDWCCPVGKKMVDCDATI